MVSSVKWLVLVVCTIAHCFLHHAMLEGSLQSADAFAMMHVFVSSDVLKSIEQLVLFVFPVMFLTLVTVDGVSRLHDNRLLVMTRLPSKTRYALEEQRILFKDAMIVVVVNAIATFAFCMIGREPSMSWLALAVVVRNLIAVVMFGEVYCFVMKAMGPSGAMVVMFATILVTAVACLVEALMSFKAGIGIWTAVLRMDDLVLFYPVILAGNFFLACAMAGIEMIWTIRKEF